MHQNTVQSDRALFVVKSKPKEMHDDRERAFTKTNKQGTEKPCKATTLGSFPNASDDRSRVVQQLWAWSSRHQHITLRDECSYQRPRRGSRVPHGSWGVPGDLQCHRATTAVSPWRQPPWEPGEPVTPSLNDS